MSIEIEFFYYKNNYSTTFHVSGQCELIPIRDCTIYLHRILKRLIICFVKVNETL